MPERFGRGAAEILRSLGRRDCPSDLAEEAMKVGRRMGRGGRQCGSVMITTTNMTFRRIQLYFFTKKIRAKSQLNFSPKILNRHEKSHQHRYE